MTRSRGTSGLQLAERPVIAVLLHPAHTLLGALVLLILLVSRAFLLMPALLLIDLAAVVGYLASPARRRAVVGRIARRRRVTAAARLRGKERDHGHELEELVTTTRASLPPARAAELERLLGLYVDVGVELAGWDAQLDRFARVPATPPPTPLKSLVLARSERRARMTQAVDALTTQLMTISTLIQLGCEDAVAARAATAAGTLATHVDEARRSAQLAVDAADEVYTAWDEQAPLKA
ncbi:MAG TPA: hypothetical protein VHB97_11490 [Polyangia bacterium]|nr:hypothetical protein [Polyangia bacterium]